MWYVFVGLGLLGLYSWLVEPALLTIRQETVQVKEGGNFQPLRLLYISDFHCGFVNSQWMQKRHLRRLWRTHQIQPYQVMVLGGDYLDRNAAYLGRFKELLDLLAQFKIPMIATLGNHDYRAYPVGVDELVTALQQAGVVVLRNEAYSLKLKEVDLFFVGLEELLTTQEYGSEESRYSLTEYREHARKLEWYRTFDSQGVGQIRILLSHNPDGVYLPGKKRPVLTLSGHTHGGQMWPLKLLGQVLPSFTPPGSFLVWSGRRELEGTTLLVSRGLGGSTFPFRLLCPPEVLSVTLQSDRFT